MWFFHKFIFIYCYVIKSNFSVPALNYAVMFGIFIEQHWVWPITHFNLELWIFAYIKIRISQLNNSPTKTLSNMLVDLLTLKLIAKGTISQQLFWIHLVLLVWNKVYYHGYVKSSPRRLSSLYVVGFSFENDIETLAYVRTKTYDPTTSNWDSMLCLIFKVSIGFSKHTNWYGKH